MFMKSFFAAAVLTLSAFALQAQTAEAPKSACCAGATAGTTAQCKMGANASTAKNNQTAEAVNWLSTSNLSTSKSKSCDPANCNPAACSGAASTSTATASTAKKSTPKAKRAS
jgi:hypothetical protein